MTAEIAILNRSAVALAADSTVTISGGYSDRRKTYNTVNKLFALSKYHPIGAMIYGDATFMDVPWETLIKQYRRQLKEKSFSTTRDYSDDVLRYLESIKAVFPESQQAKEMLNSAQSIFGAIGKEIDADVRKHTENGEPISEAKIQEIAEKVVESWRSYADTKPLLASVDEYFTNALSNAYGDQIENARQAELGKFNLSDDFIGRLTFIVTKIVASGSGAKTGLVMAGFGEDELFPSVRTVQVYRMLLGRVLYGEDGEESHSVASDGAVLLPFAQKDVVHAFLTGCEPSYLDMMAGTFGDLFDKYPEMMIAKIAATVGDLQDNQRAAITKEISEDFAKIQKEFIEKFSAHRNKKHIQPLLEVIASLPIDELAAMAEALVNLTSVKRKMSLELETVGGPIDVAVISKGDGFIWISRKHYFKPELNPHFAQTYFKR